jgi:hypothetical protein
MRRQLLNTSVAFCCLLALAGAAIAQTGGVCGTPAVTTLYAGQTIDAGTVTVSNDSSNVYVTFSTRNGWQLTETHLAIASTLAGIPQTKSGNPKVGNFPYQRSYNPSVTSDVYVFSLDQLAVSLGFDRFTCGSSSFVVAAHAVVVQQDGSGGVTARETGWGAGTGFPGGNWATYFGYTVQCCAPTGIQPGDFRTQTQGGWGAACHGTNPGCYRDDHFASCFSAGGLAVGDPSGYTATFTSTGAVEGFLPQGGPAASLIQSHIDPTSTEAGVLAGQTVALTLSVSFDICDPDFGASPLRLRNLVVCEATSACNQRTVGNLLDEANAVLAGLPSVFTAAEISECLARVNENFVDGTQVGTYLCLPPSE